MIKVDVSTIIDAPLEKVWDFMADLGTMPQRDHSVVRVDWQPPLGVGSVATVTARLMGERTGRLEVKELEPNHRLVVQMTGMGARAEGTYEFEPVDERRTKLSAAVSFQVRGLLRVISPYLSYSAKRDATAEFERIKSAIEASEAV